jgi:hypothetical protein
MSHTGAHNETLEEDFSSSEDLDSEYLYDDTHCIPLSDDFNDTNASYVEQRFCERDPPEWLAWYVKAQTGLSIAMCYVLPMAIIAALYCKTAHTLVTSGTLERGNSADRLRRKRTHAAR